MVSRLAIAAVLAAMPITAFAQSERGSQRLAPEAAAVEEEASSSAPTQRDVTTNPEVPFVGGSPEDDTFDPDAGKPGGEFVEAEPEADFDPDAGKPLDEDLVDLAPEVPEMPEMPAAAVESSADVAAIIGPDRGALLTVLRRSHGNPYGDPAYTRNIYRTPTTVWTGIGAQDTFDRSAPRIGRLFVLNMNHSHVFTVGFAKESWALTPDALAEIDVLAEVLSAPELAPFTYVIGGHTDATGAKDYNHWLSQKRAHAVRDYLVRTHGLDPARLVAVGYGEDYPLHADAPNDPRNRRIEVTLVEDVQRRNVPLAEVPLFPRYTPDDFAYTERPVYERENPLCDDLYAVADPRPPRHNLDDFGGANTPVACADRTDYAPGGYESDHAFYGAPYAAPTYSYGYGYVDHVPYLGGYGVRTYDAPHHGYGHHGYGHHRGYGSYGSYKSVPHKVYRHHGGGGLGTYQTNRAIRY